MSYKVDPREKTIFQPAVEDKDLTIPPAYSKGKRYIIAIGGSGAWNTKDNYVVDDTGVGWSFIAPKEGMITWVKDENKFYYYNGSAWYEMYLHQSNNDIILKAGAGADLINDGTLKNDLAVDAGKKITGQNDILVNGGTVGTSGVGVIAIKKGTIPSSSPAEEVQLYADVANTAIDNMEYATNGAAQAAYVTNATLTSQYPTQNADYVKATTSYSANHLPYFATDPTKILTGSWTDNVWLSADGQNVNQRFHIDLGSAKIITRIYYENAHWAGTTTGRGVKNFTLWGSNTVGDFTDLVYANNGTWVQLATSQSTFDQHVALDQVDPKYITVTNVVAYRYYAFKFADSWEGINYMGVRRIELQSLSLQSYSEATIKTQGTYSLKGLALITDSNGKTLTRTVSPVIDLTKIKTLKFDIYSSRTGANIKIGIHDSGGTTTEKTYTVLVANTQESVTWDISAISDANKDAIDSIIITILNADAENTFYIDNFYLVGLAEGKVRDEAGNITTISPHNFKNIPKEIIEMTQKESDGMAWSYHSEKDKKEITVDMYSAIKDLEKVTGKKYIYINENKND